MSEGEANKEEKDAEVIQKTKRIQPPWFEPSSDEPAIDFVPEGKTVKWYTCGPTVYDSSHLGHARTYLSFDIIKRIMEKYFGYNIFYCMNITDIDDKIILKARQTYLFSEYQKNNTELTETVKKDLDEAWTKNIDSLNHKIVTTIEQLKNLTKGSKVELEALKANYKTKLRDATKTREELPSQTDIKLVLDEGKAVLSELLDKRYGLTLDPELVKKICMEVSTKFEKEYFDDMKMLGVSPPDSLVRVSEHVHLCVDMSQKIIENGYAYECEGSVYFDTSKFHNTQPHVYGKLRPEAIGDIDLLKEGEGGLTDVDKSILKRKSDKDFALWKGSKDGEPAWDSPFGKGRPGWHIECSAMAGEILGSVIDIHCGGEDLKFPHHDNEMAQAEAFFDNKQWINYFFHTGHLEIDGLKMSKSLKNFITIREILSQFSATQIRMLFLLQSWDKKMNYQRVNTMNEADSKILAFSEFLKKVNQFGLEVSFKNSPPPEAWNEKDKQLHASFQQTIHLVDLSLKDNFDTSKTIQHLIDLIKKANTYTTANDAKKFLLLNKIADFIKKILDVFGLNLNTVSANAGETTGTKEEVLFPYVQALATFRKNVRILAKKNANLQTYMELCDTLRDDQLIDLGIKIVDDGETDFFFGDPIVLKEEVRQKKAKSLKLFLDKKVKDLENLRLSQLTPSQLIEEKHNIIMASKESIPEKDKNEKDVSKGLKGKLPKEWDNQIAANTKFQTQLEKNPNVVQDLKDEIARIQLEINNL